MNSGTFFENVYAMFGENLIWYAGFAFPFFILFWIVGKKYLKKLRIQETQRANLHHFKHDLAYSATTFLVFAIMDAVFLYLEGKGYTKIYLNTNEYGFWWLGLSFFVVLFMDDMFFYWSHRAMHQPRLYKFFHRVHHESTDPSPLTAFAFHPSEAVVENLMHFVLPFVLPLNFGVMIAWQIFSMFNNVLAHLGYEIYPKGWIKLPFFKFKTASTHHNMHHQLFNGNYGLYFTWWDKWMGTEFRDYEIRHEQIFERKRIKKSKDGFYTLAVADVKPEANDAFTIQFSNVPSVFIDFSAGQHITIKVHIEGQILFRTFSISSVPNTGNSLTITLKRIRNGIVTNYLAENLKVGDFLEVSPPSGQFCLTPEPSNRKHYVMIAGGSGITPIFSMIGTLLKFEPQSKISLLYANKTSDSTIFKDELHFLEKEYPAQLEVKHFLSREVEYLKAAQGHITRSAVEEFINRLGKVPIEFYLCGPELMTNSIIKYLGYLGIPQDKIHAELFLINSSNLKDAGQNARVSARILDQDFQFEVQEGSTILKSGISSNVPLPYSCQSGLCGMCRMKCSEGKVLMLNNQVLTEEEIKQGYFLTCQAVPQTPNVSIYNS